MKIVCVLSLLIFLISLTEGRVCWHCENAASVSACLQFGYAKKCLKNQVKIYLCCHNSDNVDLGHCALKSKVKSIVLTAKQSSSVEFIHSPGYECGRFVELTKRCKQDMSCDNNQYQNTSGSIPFQCEEDYPHMVCRCCCGYDNCNKYTTCPSGNGTCQTPEDPENGFTVCYSDPQRVGDRCIYRCNLGYTLVGEEDTVCELNIDGDTMWSNPPPSCQGITACDEVDPPLYGSRTYSDGVYIGSVASFTCDDGYIIFGPESIVCTAFGMWSNDPPVCLVAACDKPKPDDKNRVLIACTDAYNLESQCTYACKKGWKLNTDYNSITCGTPMVNYRGTWDKPAPTCIRDECLEPDNIQDKKIKCTDDYLVGSICDISCVEPGHYLDSNGVVINRRTFKIKCTSSATWDKLVPDCVPVTCRPKTRDPRHGSHSCTLGNTYTSVCDFVCDEGYHIKGKPSIQCLADKNFDQYGKWSARQPTCAIDGCTEPDNIDDKTIICKPLFDYTVGTICEISCKEPGHYFQSQTGVVRKRTVTIRCKDDGSWDKSIPDCLPVTCLPEAGDPTHGSHSCTLDNTYSSVCKFFCDEPYSINGEPSIQCLADNNYDPYGKWSNLEPTCLLLSCADWGPVNKGVITCQPLSLQVGSRWKIGTECTLTCEDLYAPKLLPRSKCVAENKWNVDPLCCVSCVVNQALDMVVLLDSTYGTANIWIDYMDFAQTYPIDLLEDGYVINYYVIPFATTVDTDSYRFYPEIAKGKLEGVKTVSVPYEGKGESNVGLALQYVNDEIFKTMPANRVPIVILVTTRRPSDFDFAIKEADKLAERGIHLRIVPLDDRQNSELGDNQELREAYQQLSTTVIEAKGPDFYTAVTDGIATVSKRRCNSKTQLGQGCTTDV